LSADWFDQVVRLRTGDAMVFAPTGLQMDENEVPKKLGSQHVLIRIRQRITTASGQSRMAVNNM
jgi:hypothetical protein